MVVLLPLEGATLTRGRPPLFGILHDNDGAPIATLRIEDYHLWSLGATCVHAVTSLAHKHLEGKWFSSLAAASQLVYGKVCGQSRTVYMQTVRLYLRGGVGSNESRSQGSMTTVPFSLLSCLRAKTARLRGSSSVGRGALCGRLVLSAARATP